MLDFLQRTELLLGAEALTKINNAYVTIVGIGGVGASCAEALVRAGVLHMRIFDFDDIDITNVNRQLFATTENVGEKKIDAAKKRLLAINPQLDLEVFPVFLNSENADLLFNAKVDYVIDAIDTVTSKLHLICECKRRSIPIISSLGTGNRIDPTKFLVGDIADTAGFSCGLARVMRHELKKRGVQALDVLYSTELPQKVLASSENGRHSPASISFCPPVAGYIIASFVVRNIIDPSNKNPHRFYGEG